MARQIIGAAAAAAALGFAAQPGWALTGAEAWDAWKTFAAEQGQTVTADSETQDGDVLTVSGVAFAVDQDELEIDGTVDRVVFTEAADGSVAVTMSDLYTLNISATPEDGETADAVMTVAVPGLEMVAREISSGIRFDYVAPEMVLTVEELVVDGETVDMTLVVTLAETTGFYEAGEDATEVVQEIGIGAMTMALAASDPDSDGTFAFDLGIADLAFAGRGAGLMMAGAADMQAMLDAGFDIEGTYAFGQSTFEIAFLDGSDSFNAAGGMTGGESTVALDARVLDVSQTLRGFEFIASGSEIPLPQVSGALGEWTTDVALPLQPADAAQPFALRLLLGDLALGEEIWSIFDAGGVLPRDPATLVLDLSGMMRPLVDFLDETAMEETDEPAQIDSVALETLRLALAGAELTGSGAFTFDNADRSAFGGMPAPDGMVSLSLKGGNGLLDRLVRMGLLPQEQAMMARMMTGMLAVPGPGPDELISEITVRPDGTVLANGAPLPF